MIGLLHPDEVDQLPIVKSWLRHADAALSVVRGSNLAASEPSALAALIEQNVLLQLHHLRTHPSVAGRLAHGSLALSGWVYDIDSGTVRVYNEPRGGFEPLVV
jgi:carbonic anhydrase